MLPHVLDNRLTDGGEVISLTRRLLFTPWEIPGTQFCYNLDPLQGNSASDSIWSIETFDNIGNRTRDLIELNSHSFSVRSHCTHISFDGA
jgi:hypothetical protein